MSAEHLIKPHTKSSQLGHLQLYPSRVGTSLSGVYGEAVSGRVGVVPVTSAPSNLNHNLNYSHNSDIRALHYEHYC